MKHVLVSVINDLSTDQRVHKVCLSLQKMGFQVTLVGRRQRKSMPLEERPYATKRMFLLFEKGPLFYAEFNLRLFLFLLFKKADVLVANDLDTLLANHWARKFKKAELIYDSHEYFTEVPELVARPKVQRFWKKIERAIFPRLKYVYTVNASIAELYKNEYGKDIRVVRNIPIAKPQVVASRKELGLPEDRKIIVLQGAGINIDRGTEEAVEAMQYVEGALFLIIGGGDVIDQLKARVDDLQLSDKVQFLGKKPYEVLMQYTAVADLGLTLDKDTNINYRYSLPNKLFDYIHAGIPVLASNLVEVRNIVKHYDVGDIALDHDPVVLAKKITMMLSDEDTTKRWKNNAKKAARELTWENEEKELIKIYSKFG